MAPAAGRVHSRSRDELRQGISWRVADGALSDRYLSSIHLDDLALACACALGDSEAWDHFVLEMRPGLHRAADALDRSGAARELADSLYADLYGLDQRGGGRQSQTWSAWTPRPRLFPSELSGPSPPSSTAAVVRPRRSSNPAVRRRGAACCGHGAAGRHPHRQHYAVASAQPGSAGTRSGKPVDRSTTAGLDKPGEPLYQLIPVPGHRWQGWDRYSCRTLRLAARGPARSPCTRPARRDRRPLTCVVPLDGRRDRAHRLARARKTTPVAYRQRQQHRRVPRGPDHRRRARSSDHQAVPGSPCSSPDCVGST